MAETIGERIADEFMRWQPDEDDYDTVRDRLQRLVDAAIAAAREEGRKETKKKRRVDNPRMSKEAKAELASWRAGNGPGR